MKLLFTSFCCFASLMASDAINCDNIKNNKTLLNKSSNLDYLNIASSCKESLKNQDFTKKLYAISNEIRGSNSSCNGVAYLPKLQQFDFLLLKIAIDPIAYQKTLDTPENLEKKYDILKSYFRYWAYQSIGNFRLYKAFWKEYNNAIEPLEKYFESNFNFDKGSNIYYTSNALNEFLNWAVGETKIYKDISPLAKIMSNKNYSVSYIQDFIFSNNPSQDDLTIALQAALLNQREKKILELLIRFGARIDEGYESAIFYALESYENTNFLIQNGANVNQKYINNNEKLALSANIGSNTPYFITFCALEHTSKNVLMHAAAYGNVEILKLLISKGANFNTVDDLGFNALDFALSAGKKENADYLKSLGLKANENLFYGGSLE
ncbi:ankyrin repeat domain-containing protein [Campylobacter jejuni]|uniref:ankyrin repeat domain-containing protein n=2 Tax=Campylobacter jejuni TaxID=197 RepID=UPI000258020A|nr:ankyrin repeat domain-containing protein [Campylobacter jejuni]EAH4588684.1 ankyrin repeat domain-containing protein [Campylobacter jejuni]EAH5638668.1 ankyrin repeat domain-containing protein [Campylobacter jejuni]EAH5666334.1 ankyrin repeat domain-containing protein [Campylobacter jejuni]EAH6137949.1 ankyrin repeat domain-containing protein [Campylobacter jejuni]EAH6899291.1 ankyrin repeat domain-containing protein [Campylobacter jejuni]